MKMQPGEVESPERKSVLQILPEVFNYIERRIGRFILIFFLLFTLSVWLLVRIVHTDQDDLLIHFLPVGQGDSELIALPGGATVLIDGGPPTLDAVRALDAALPSGIRSIDVVIMTHPHLDHFGGLIDVAKRYRIGAFISNGLSSNQASFRELKKTLEDRRVPRITFGAGDSIHYASSVLIALAPSLDLGIVKNQNEAVLVLELLARNTKTLFMSDATSDVEGAIGKIAGKIDILKVSHHGSKFSSSETFLKTALPRFAFVEVGKNSYGHPTPQALARLGEIGAKVFRTDKDGLITVRSDGATLFVLK